MSVRKTGAFVVESRAVSGVKCFIFRRQMYFFMPFIVVLRSCDVCFRHTSTVGRACSVPDPAPCVCYVISFFYVPGALHFYLWMLVV